MILAVFAMGLGGLVLSSLWRMLLLLGVRRDQRELRESVRRMAERLERLAEEVRGSRGDTHEQPPVKPQATPEPGPHRVVPTTDTGKASVTGRAPEGKPPPAPVATDSGSRRPAKPSVPGPVTQKVLDIETAALVLLRKAWNWFIVGEEYRDPARTVEYAVAITWGVRLGIVMCVVGIASGLRHSFETGLIGPAGRVLLGVVTGVGMVAGGVRLLGRRYHLLGQGLIGGGLATLYVITYAAHHFYGLVENAWVAFGLMGLVTVAAGVLAVSVSSMLIAILGIVGGYVTPFVLSGSTAGYGSFFTYLLVLGLGILAIGHFRQWILLNYLGMGFTYVHVVRAVHSGYSPESFATVMLFLVLFFALYSAVVIVYNLANRRPCTLLEVLGLLVNSAVFFWQGQALVEGSFSRPWVAVLTLCLAAFYLVLVFAFLKRGLRDRALLLTLTALAWAYLAMTMPLLLSREWLTVSWSVLALLLLWLSRRVNSRFLHALSCVLYTVVVVRLFALDLVSSFGDAEAAVPVSRYLRELGERLVVFGVPIASFVGAWRLHRTAPRETGELTVPKEADTVVLVRDHSALAVFLGAAALASFVYVHLELNRMFGVVFDPLRLPVITGLWLALGMVFLLLRHRTDTARWLDLFFWGAVTVAVLKLLYVDLRSWGFDEQTLRFGSGYSWLEAAMRALDFGMIIGFSTWAASQLRGRARTGAQVPAVTALVIAFSYLSLEANTFLYAYIPDLQRGGVSMVWSAFALGLVIHGIRRRDRAPRLAGLVLFAVVGLKVFFLDLAHLTSIYRMLALVVMGIITLFGSFLYLKNAEHFQSPQQKETDG
jgi:uncharacterized membrane protein